MRCPKPSRRMLLSLRSEPVESDLTRLNTPASFRLITRTSDSYLDIASSQGKSTDMAVKETRVEPLVAAGVLGALCLAFVALGAFEKRRRVGSSDGSNSGGMRVSKVVPQDTFAAAF